MDIRIKLLILLCVVCCGRSTTITNSSSASTDSMKSSTTPTKTSTAATTSPKTTVSQTTTETPTTIKTESSTAIRKESSTGSISTESSQTSSTANLTNVASTTVTTSTNLPTQTWSTQKPANDVTTTTVTISTRKTTQSSNKVTTTSTGTSDKSKYTPEDKQRINGLVSAAICVGSLILIGLAFLSSFVDRPTEKLSKDIQERFKRDASRKRKESHARMETAEDRNVSFDNQKDNKGTAYHRPNGKQPISTSDIELQPSTSAKSTDVGENKLFEIKSKELPGEMPGQGSPGKFMSTHQPQNTSIQG